MAKKKSSSNQKSGLNQVLEQAKESFKVLQTFERETLEKAKNWVHFPNAAERKRFAQSKIIPNLRKIGLATAAEVNALEAKIEKLEASLHSKDHSKHSTAQS